MLLGVVLQARADLDWLAYDDAAKEAYGIECRRTGLGSTSQPRRKVKGGK